MTTGTAFFDEANLQALLDKIAKDEGFKNPKYSIGSGSKPGQNFIGRVFRAVITEDQDGGDEKKLSLIFKASFTNRGRNEMMGGDMLFRTEKEMYEIVLPTLNDFLKKHGVADHPTFPGTPRCFATEINNETSPDKADVVVLEDKSVEGFQTVSFKTGLNAEQVRLALKRVALLHATAMALQQLEPESAAKIRKLLNKDYTVERFQKAIDDLKQAFTGGLAMLEEPYRPGNPTYDKLHGYLDNFGEKFIERYDPLEDYFTIAHCDFTSNNVMFKVNEDGSTEDALLIDFQTSACISVANDLASIFLPCTSKDVRDEHFEKLLRFYFDEITRVLRAFGCDSDKIFPWNVLQKHLNRYMIFGVLLGLMGLPVLLADLSEIKVDIHSAEECGENMFSKIAEVTNTETIKQIKRRIHDLVSDSERWGYI